MATTSRWSVTIAFAVSTGLLPPLVHARTAPASEPATPAVDPRAEQLRDLYARGQAAFDAGSYETAIQVFEEAYAISKDPNLLFNISLCHDRLGNYDAALQTLDRYAAESPDADKADVERRRQSLVVRKERAAKAAAEPEPRGPVGAPDEPAATKPPPEGARSERLFSPAAWTLTAVSIAGFGVGIALGSLSLARKGAADCTPVQGDTICDADGARAARDSRRYAIVADVGIGVGAVAAVAVIAIVATRAAQRRRPKETAWQPYVGPRGAGLSLARRF